MQSVSQEYYIESISQPEEEMKSCEPNDIY